MNQHLLLLELRAALFKVGFLDSGQFPTNFAIAPEQWCSLFPRQELYILIYLTLFPDAVPASGKETRFFLADTAREKYTLVRGLQRKLEVCNGFIN